MVPEFSRSGLDCFLRRMNVIFHSFGEPQSRTMVDSANGSLFLNANTALAMIINWSKLIGHLCWKVAIESGSDAKSGQLTLLTPESLVI